MFCSVKDLQEVLSKASRGGREVLRCSSRVLRTNVFLFGLGLVNGWLRGTHG